MRLGGYLNIFGNEKLVKKLVRCKCKVYVFADTASRRKLYCIQCPQSINAIFCNQPLRFVDNFAID